MSLVSSFASRTSTACIDPTPRALLILPANFLSSRVSPDVSCSPTVRTCLKDKAKIEVEILIEKVYEVYILQQILLLHAVDDRFKLQRASRVSHPRVEDAVALHIQTVQQIILGTWKADAVLCVADSVAVMYFSRAHLVRVVEPSHLRFLAEGDAVRRRWQVPALVVPPLTSTASARLHLVHDQVRVALRQKH